jgi:hypothetical protein
MYRVIKFFTDLQDNRYAYNVGDEFPHEGIEVSPKRLEELSTGNNKRGIPLIEKIEEEPLTEEAPEIDPDEAPVEEEPVEKPKAKRGRKKG